MNKIIVSGMRPTGNLHLGSYFGALKSFISLQEEHKCYFFIADYHSLTTHPNPKDLHNNVRIILSQYLACGLDPDKATIYPPVIRDKIRNLKTSYGEYVFVYQTSNSNKELIRILKEFGFRRNITFKLDDIYLELINLFKSQLKKVSNG